MFLGVVADDLTGAADSVVPFTSCGMSVHVGLNISRGGQDEQPDSDVLALNTGLRDRNGLNATLIASITRRATRRLKEHDPQLYYKKIDSTLRGSLRTELEGMRRELPDRIALICPASPANGRTVVNGTLYVHGVPHQETEFGAKIEVEGAETVRATFGMRDDSTAAEIGLATVRAGEKVLRDECSRLINAGVQTIFCDAALPSDLETLAHIVLAEPKRFLPVGSAGLTRAMATCLPAIPSRSENEWAALLFRQGRILVLVGSRSQVSRMQLAYLAKVLDTSPIVLGGQSKQHEETLQEWVRSYEADNPAYNNNIPPDPEIAEIWNLLSEGRNIILLTTQQFDHRLHLEHKLRCIFPRLTNLADGEQDVVPFDGYIATGGDAARELCFALRGFWLEVIGEAEPGVVRTSLLCENGVRVPFILKAGGFGDVGTLARCLGLE